MTASNLTDAQLLASEGWPVFPGYLDERGRKVPIGSLVEHGLKDATTHARKIEMWWRVRPDALIGVALPVGTMAVDVDDPEKFESSGLEFPDAPEQQTPSGGYHRLYATDGRPVRQTIKAHPGVDTRVGGKGYVIAWEPSAFGLVEDLPAAPEWVYGGEDEPEREARDAAADADLLIGEDGATHRDQLVTYAGRLRWAGSTAKEILAALREAHAAGRIVDGDEAWPWSDNDFVLMAKDIGSKPGPEKAPVITINMVPHEKPAREKVKTQTATALLEEKFDPLLFLVEKMLPEGFGVVAGAPKVGKSWLVLQTCLCVSTGRRLLGNATHRRPVLYYALEDSERRLQRRLTQLLGKSKLDLRLLELAYDAPAIGQGLEDDIDEWLTSHPGGLVAVDVLAKVRPAAKGRGSAYDEDYATLKPLQDVARAHSGSAVAVVTHDRKAGSDDILTTVTGTRGVTGSADWIWVVKRPRLERVGSIYVNGRDVEDESIGARLKESGEWVLDTTPLPGKGKPKNAVYMWFEKNGPAFATAAANALGKTRQAVQNDILEMVPAGELIRTEHGYITPGIPVNYARRDGVIEETLDDAEETPPDGQSVSEGPETVAPPADVPAPANARAPVRGEPSVSGVSGVSRRWKRSPEPPETPRHLPRGRVKAPAHTRGNIR